MLAAGNEPDFEMVQRDHAFTPPPAAERPIKNQMEMRYCYILTLPEQVKMMKTTKTTAYGVGFEVSHRGGNVPPGTVALPGGGGSIGLGGNKIAPSQSTFASPRGLVEFNRRNMRGLGETASASILFSRLDQRVLTTYAQPHFIGSQWQSLTSSSVERNSQNPLFTAGFGDLSFQVERLISRKSNTRLQVRYNFNKTNLSHLLVPDLVLDQDRHLRLSTLSATLIRDTRDKPLDAHRGSFSTINLVREDIRRCECDLERAGLLHAESARTIVGLSIGTVRR